MVGRRMAKVFNHLWPIWGEETNSPLCPVGGVWWAGSALWGMPASAETKNPPFMQQRCPVSIWLDSKQLDRGRLTTYAIHYTLSSSSSGGFCLHKLVNFSSTAMACTFRTFSGLSNIQFMADYYFAQRISPRRLAKIVDISLWLLIVKGW